MTRKDILIQAEKCVNGSREEDYGSPEQNFERIAKLWNAYLGDILVDAHDVAMMMSLLKIARARSNRKADNYIDLAGYAACAGEIVAQNPEQKNDVVRSIMESYYVKKREAENVGS